MSKLDKALFKTLEEIKQAIKDKTFIDLDVEMPVMCVGSENGYKKFKPTGEKVITFKIYQKVKED